jgi:hypothetical protein
MLGGTVRYAVENIGRQLINVDFDTGQSLMVLADDVIFDDTKIATASNG